MIVRLDDELWFPDPKVAEPEDGLIAIGGDFSVERLALAYSNGFFPWYAFRPEDNMFLPDDWFEDDGTPLIRWYCPQQRFVIFPSEVHISHSMKQMMKRPEYEVTFGIGWDEVLRNCSQLRIDEPGAWLGERVIKAYTELYNLGLASCVAVWRIISNEDGTEEKKLIGGLYGVTIGKSFFGESMFSLEPSASKLALIYLAKCMAQDGTALIDCQFHTDHLESMGGRYISYEEYMRILKLSFEMPESETNSNDDGAQ